MSGHKFLAFEAPKPGRRVVREVVVTLMNGFFHANLSRSRWLKLQRQPVAWWRQGRNGQREHRTSKPIDLRMIEARLEKGIVTFEDLDLFDPRCEWLDAAVAAGPQFHFVDQNGETLKLQMTTTLGSSFPLVPRLDREGYAYNSFQLMILRRMGTLRRALVENSDDYVSTDWFQDLRSLVAECVSLIDVTLHQLYFKAAHSPLPGWRFERERLGDRHARRLKDKLGWVHQITGRSLNADAEVRTLTEIKEIRNHLQHFDPPCFCYTLEDAARWLNAVSDIAALAWKMRTCLGSPLCMPLVELLVSPPVLFVPKDPSRRRLPQGDDVGYGSTRWPGT